MKIEINSRGSGYVHEQRYGLIASLSIHSIVFILFFALSIHKGSNDVKTFYIQFTQMGEHTLQETSIVKKMRVHKISDASKKDVITLIHHQKK